MRWPATLVRKAKDIARNEGLLSVAGHGLFYMSRCLFAYVRCYLYELMLADLDETDFVPRLENLTCITVRSNEEADGVAATIGSDFRRQFINARRCLDRGAIAYCIFHGGEIAYIGWVGTSEEAQKSMGQPPYRVDFAGGEAFTGGVWTDARHRRMGLAAFGYFRRLELLRSEGRLLARAAVATENVATQGMLAKFGARRYAEGRYLRLLWWRYWREVSLASAVE